MLRGLFSFLRTLMAVVLMSSAVTAYAGGGDFPLERAPDRTQDPAALQRGAKFFVNYCLNCHGAQSMRYNRLQDIGLNEAQIRDNLLFTSDKVGDTMVSALREKDGKEWFGAKPPDLSVIARAKASGAGSGADYLYTYLRTYYRDESTATGWNNLAFPNVGMPHVMWELQGQRRAIFAERKDPHDPSKVLHVFDKFETITPGIYSQAEYDSAIADLVSFLVYMGEPARSERVRLGVIVLMFLAVFTLVAWRLNAVYWKDIR